MDACPTCKKNLSECDTIESVFGILYCSAACAIISLCEEYGESAETMFNMSAEEINPRDIGIGGDDNE